MKIRMALCCVLLLTFTAVPASATCFSLQVEEPLLSISLTSNAMSRLKTHNGSKDRAMGTASGGSSAGSGTVLTDLDAPLQLDNGAKTIDSLLTLDHSYNSGTLTCFSASVYLYDASVSLGRVIYGACEPTIVSSASVTLEMDIADGLYLPDLTLNLNAGVDVTCGWEPVAWVSGGLSADAEFTIERSSYRRLKRALSMTVTASAEAGIVGWVVWDWSETVDLGEVVSSYVNV